MSGLMRSGPADGGDARPVTAFPAPYRRDLVNDLRNGRGLTEVPNEDGAVLRDAWVHSIMHAAADEIERLRALAAVCGPVGKEVW